MKIPIYIVFLLGYTCAVAQPPVERNSITNSVHQEQVQKETVTGTVPEKVAETSDATTNFNNFIFVYNKANTSGIQKTPDKLLQQQMNQLVQQSYLQDSESFEYNLGMFMAGNYDLSRKTYLEKAKAIQADNPYVLLQSAGVNHIIDNEKALSSDLKALKKQNKWNKDDFSYARDVLASVSKHGILVTHGIDDSYPVLYLQSVEKYRRDVTVIPLHLLQSKEYVSRLQEKQLVLPPTGIINIQYLDQFCSLNNSSNIHLALTIPQAYFQQIPSYLYPVGLTFHYSASPLKNNSMNTDLWNTTLNKSVITGSESETGRQLSANYLPTLVSLYRYYESENNSSQTKSIKNTIKQIGVNIGSSSLLNDLGIE